MSGASPPIVGQVISYSYLWSREADLGREEGLKSRPCVVVIAVRRSASGVRIWVAPITHSRPERGQGLQLPATAKMRLGLDAELSWVVTTELNEFTWPGEDVRPIPTKAGFIYGDLAARFVEKVRAQLAGNRPRSVSRDAR